MYLVAPLFGILTAIHLNRKICAFWPLCRLESLPYCSTELRRLQFEKQAIKTTLTLNMLWKNHRHQTDFAIVCI